MIVTFGMISRMLT